MKALLLASLLAFSAVCAAQSPPATPQQVEALMALARTYGVVRYFHPSDSLDQVRWDRFLVHAAARMGSTPDASEIGPRLEELFTPMVEGFRVAAPGTATKPPQGEGPKIEWRHLGYGLETDANLPYASWRTHHDPVREGKVKGGYFQHRAAAEASVQAEPVMRVPVSNGLEAHVPVSMPMSATKVGEAQKGRLDALEKTLAGVDLATDAVTRAQAHADGIAAWNVARHFYPYWDVVKLDWEATLRDWLARQPATQTRAQLRDELRRLTAPLDDGHVSIADPQFSPPRAFLPISVRPLGEAWVVDASQVPDKVRAGDVLAAIDGKPAQAWFDERLALLSGSAHHKRWRARFELMSAPRDSTVTLRLLRGRQSVEATLPYTSAQPLQAPRPAAMHEVRPGIHYVDVSRFDKAAFEKAIDSLRQAKGVIFDARGYPARDAVALVPYWLTAEDPAQWMFVPRFDKPFAQTTAAWSIGWQARRNPVLEKPVKVLLADGRTISYAESLAAYFPAQRTGPIVGERTAGANGNVARATLPSAMSFFFTSMRVTRHDGTTTLHREGIAPDVPASPTPEGLRAGRDEVLERAIAHIERPASR
jgi:C-terminal processing protease CtpA/Prc